MNVGDIDGDGKDDYVPVSGRQNPGIAPEPGFQADDNKDKPTCANGNSCSTDSDCSDGSKCINRNSSGTEGCLDIIIGQGKTISPGCGRQVWNELL